MPPETTTALVFGDDELTKNMSVYWYVLVQGALAMLAALWFVGCLPLSPGRSCGERACERMPTCGGD